MRFLTSITNIDNLKPTASNRQEEKRPDEERLFYLVNMLSLSLPLTNNCLLRSLVVKHLLKLAGTESTLRFGCKKDSEELLTAHAWLENSSGSIIGQESTFSYQAFSAN